jgi:hypothetical protein
VRETRGTSLRQVCRATVLLVLVAIASSSGVACGGGDTKPAATAADPAAAKKLSPASVQGVVGHLLGSIAERTIGPFLARIPAAPSAAGDAGGAAASPGSIVAWVTPAEATSRRVIAIPLTAGGEPRGPAKTVATVGLDTTMLVVRSSRGPTPGVALAWTVLTDRGEALWSVVVGDDGAPRGKPVELARTADDVVWVDLIATDLGAVILWAEETRGGDANILAASLDSDGKVRGVPARVARAVAGWHALELPSGVGLSTVAASASPADKPDKPAHPDKQAEKADKPADQGDKSDKAAPRGGALTFQMLDADGHAGSAPVAIVARPVVSGDVEVVRGAGRLVFAWTDHTTEDPSVMAAALGDDGKVEPAHRVVEARGGAALMGLAAGPAGTAVMWEAPARHTSDTRRLYSARIAPSLALEGRPSSFEISGRAAPEMAATDAGFAILVPLRDCDEGSPRCPDAAIVPTVVRTDAQLVPVQREPFGFGADPASMAWGMTCEHDVCVALAASGAAPARVRAAEVRARTNLQASAVAAATQARDGARVTEVTAIVTGESVVDIAVTHIGETTIVATLSAKAEAAGAKGHAASGTADDARNAPLVLSTRSIDAAGVVSAPTVITTRALAVGGVAIAPAGKPEDGGAVVWVARDNGDPEVHVTKIDKKGKKGTDLQLTTIKGDASDVAIAWAGGGWVVAWVDGRDGNGEVYATRVSPELGRGTGERITNAPGDASDLVAFANGDLVWLAWADPRESPKDGMADIFVTAVRMKDAKRAFDEQRVLATAAHSRTPQLSAIGDKMYVAWIEEAPMGVESPASSGYGAMLGTLGANGKTTKNPVKLPLGGEGAATSVALEGQMGEPDTLRAVIARSMTDAIVLDAVDIALGSPPIPLLTLDGPPSLDVALVLDKGALYFNDDGPSASDKRARKAHISWLAAPPKP